MFFQSVIHYFDDKEITCQISLFTDAAYRDYSLAVIPEMTPSHAYKYLTGPNTDAWYHCQVKRVRNNLYQFFAIDAVTQDILMTALVSRKEPDAVLAEGLMDFLENIKEYT